MSPEDSELPLLRYIFVHHVRNFPFLDKANEKEFWQDKLQQVSGMHWRGLTAKRDVFADLNDFGSSFSSRLPTRTSPRPKTVWKKQSGRNSHSRRKNWSSS